MGLDMYGYTMNAEFVGDRQTDVNVSEDERDEAELNQFAYWRKIRKFIPKTLQKPKPL